MPLFAVYAKDKPAPSGRTEHVEAHRAGLRELAAAGRIVFAGPLLNDQGTPCGSLVIFEAADMAAAQATLQADPYMINGVFESVELTPVMKVLPQA